VLQRQPVQVRCVPEHRGGDPGGRLDAEGVGVPRLEYVRADDVDSAVALVTADPGAAYLAGGTTQLDLLLKDRVIEAGRLVDIGPLPLRDITRGDGMLRVGALTTMEELAADQTVRERLPLVRQALLGGGPPQVRDI